MMCGAPRLRSVGPKSLWADDGCVKTLICHYKCSLEAQEEATETELKQAEMQAAEWVGFA